MKKEAVLHLNTEDFIYPVARNSLVVKLRTAKSDLSDCHIIHFCRTKPDVKNCNKLEKKYSDDLFDYYECRVDFSKFARYQKYFFKLTGNDGEDEYVICSVFGNTAAEYYMKYIYKFKDGEMVQLYPNSDISDMGISENEPINTEIIKVNVGDQELNGLEAVTYEKDNGVAYDRFHAIIYYNEDHWEIIETIDDYKKENASTED